MPKKAPPPRIEDLLPAGDYTASNLASENASNAPGPAPRGDGYVQLNTRVPVDLHAELIQVQGAFTRDRGRKPSMQDLVAACLRVALDHAEALQEAMGMAGLLSRQDGQDSNRGGGEGPDG